MQRPWGEGEQGSLKQGQGAQPGEVGAGGPLGARGQTAPFTNLRAPPPPLPIPRQDLGLARQLHHRERQGIGRSLVTCGREESGSPTWPAGLRLAQPTGPLRPRAPRGRSRPHHSPWLSQTSRYGGDSWPPPHLVPPVRSKDQPLPLHPGITPWETSPPTLRGPHLAWRDI